MLGILVLTLAACTEATIEKVDSAPSASVQTEASASPSSAAKPAAEEKKESPEPEQEEIYKIGDSVKFDDLVITVNGVRESKSEFFSPGEGNVIILVDVTAENKGDKEEAISSIMQTELVDEDGFSYNMTFVDDGKGNFDGTVGVGRKLRGEIAYEVPKEAKLEFIFQSPFKSGQAIWKIQ